MVHILLLFTLNIPFTYLRDLVFWTSIICMQRLQPLINPRAVQNFPSWLRVNVCVTFQVQMFCWFASYCKGVKFINCHKMIHCIIDGIPNTSWCRNCTIKNKNETSNLNSKVWSLWVKCKLCIAFWQGLGFMTLISIFLLKKKNSPNCWVRRE